MVDIDAIKEASRVLNEAISPEPEMVFYDGKFYKRITVFKGERRIKQKWEWCDSEGNTIDG